MSRIGKKPIEIPQGVTVTVAGDLVKVKGPKGELSRPLPPLVHAKVEGNKVIVTRENEERRSRGMHGLARTLITNMVTGAHKGFVRELEINGVGYKAEAKQGVLSIAMGYSHPIELVLPKGVTVKVEKNRVEVMCADKEVLGQFCAIFREQRPPEPYKGKGIKYVQEKIRRKVGKAGAS